MTRDDVRHQETAVREILSLPLPSGWVRTTVGDVGDVRLGRQRSPKNRSGKHATKYIRAANIRWYGLDLTDVLDMDFRPAELETHRLLPGDVLLSEASGSAGEVGKPAVWNGEIENCCFQNTVVRFRSSATLPRFAYLAFSHFARNGVFSRICKGVGIHHLSADRFSALPFLLPPITEQQRIVAAADELLSDLDAGVAALERAKANLKRYRASVLKAAVEGRMTESWRANHPPKETGERLLKRILSERRRKWEEDQLAAFAAVGKEPQNNWRARYVEPAPANPSGLSHLPEGWCWATIEQLLAEPLCNGISVKGTDAPPGVAALRLSAMTDHGFDYSERRFIKIAEQVAAELQIRAGDFFVSRGNGSLQLVGRGTLAQDPNEQLVFPDTMIRLRSLQSPLLPMFVAAIWPSRFVRRQVERKARTTAGIYKISQRDVREFVVPLPSRDEQRKIVDLVAAHLSEADTAATAVERGLLRAAHVRQSILKHAFEGKLVAQDPADEPAAVMLARITQSRAVAAEVRSKGKQNSDEFRRRAAIVSYTVKRLAAQPSFGRTQLEKTFHLAQSHLGIDLGLEFERYAAGPFDKSIYRLEGTANKSGWFTKKNRPRIGVTYHPGPKIDSMCEHALRLLGEKQPDFDRLLDHIATMNTDEAELFSTAYAAWNDLLIDGFPNHDDDVMIEIYCWHKSKKKFSSTAILNCLRWMRRNNYVPSGQGQKTKPMKGGA